ncbi:hypothetical protein BEI60_05210 [Eisenbergiella tayi]|nr:hypothetical protein BEI60_05210 [Eisenbergiella tayi]
MTEEREKRIRRRVCSLFSSPPFPSSPGGGGCGFGSSLKKGMFLNVPFCREAANAAKLLTSD